MSGAYVALPPVVVVPDIPDGWPFDWMFPGPAPPGYAFELAFGVVAPALMAPGTPVTDISATLTDHETFETMEPSTEHVWTAEWSDTEEPLQLKISGFGEFQDNVSSGYSSIGDFWGSEQEFEFDVSLADVGRTFFLRANDTPFESYTAEGEVEIEVVAELEPPVISFDVECVVTGEPNTDFDNWYYSGKAFVRRNPSSVFSSGTTFFDQAAGYSNSTVENLAEASVVVSNGLVTITVSEVSELATSYTVSYQIFIGASNFGNNPPVIDPVGLVTLSFTIRSYSDGDLIRTGAKVVTRTRRGLGAILTIGTINASTGNISIY